jgi:tetratricopeptide (TPR) repeat protein
MAKQNVRDKGIQAKRPAAQTSSGTILFTAVVCLAVGLGIGYYLGRESSSTAAPATANPPATPLADPGAFNQEEAGLKSALSAKPNDPQTLIRLGNLYYDNARYKEAVDYYGRALEIDPSNANVRTDRGTSYWNLGQADAAIAEFNKSLAVDPNHAQTLFNLGVVHLHGKNDRDAARKAWERLLSSNPNYPERAKVQQQLAGLSAAGTAAAAPAGPSGDNSSGVEDLLQRMKTNR